MKVKLTPQNKYYETPVPQLIMCTSIDHFNQVLEDTNYLQDLGSQVIVLSELNIMTELENVETSMNEKYIISRKINNFASRILNQDYAHSKSYYVGHRYQEPDSQFIGNTPWHVDTMIEEYDKGVVAQDISILTGLNGATAFSFSSGFIHLNKASEYEYQPLVDPKGAFLRITLKPHQTIIFDAAQAHRTISLTKDAARFGIWGLNPAMRII